MPLYPPNKQHPLDRLMDVMKRLRDPDGGCPWDLEQDFASIAPHTIEEAYEVADAIARGDLDDLKEELGDLLFQSVYHAQMADEQGAFNLHDVIEIITNKMVERHPHVFGDAEAQTASDVNQLWDEKKAQEKQSLYTLDSVTKALPALLRAQKLQKKAAKAGFEWKDPQGAFEKFQEELGELHSAAAKNDRADMQEEFGDALFALVNWGRMLGLDAETALRESNDKFQFRFNGMEDDLKVECQSMSDLSLGQMIQLWNAQKDKKGEVSEEAPTE